MGRGETLGNEVSSLLWSWLARHYFIWIRRLDTGVLRQWEVETNVWFINRVHN